MLNRTIIAGALAALGLCTQGQVISNPFSASDQPDAQTLSRASRSCVLAPELSYSNLGIHDGAAASLTWSKIISGELDAQECARLRANLRDYCALDSYGMYAIWRALTNLIQIP